MALIDRLQGVAKKNKYASILSESKSANKGVVAPINIPILNVALSGDLNGGLYAGITQIVGDSRCFKTCYGLIMMAAYLEANPDGYALFFDSENGASFEYFDTFGIDKDRVIHLPVEDVEDLRIQCAQFLKDIEQDDKVFFFIDSVGLLPSRKESEDAEDGKTTADMTRARALNSFWRIVTIPLGLKNLPMVAINHYYETMALYPEKVIKGGKGGFLASNDIWLVTRSKVKDGKELTGWSFNVKIMKSRKVKEDAVIPVVVKYDGGIDHYSGLLEVGRATGFIEMPSKGWYVRKNIEDSKRWRRAEMDGEFWKPLLEDQNFVNAVKDLYSLSTGHSAFNMENIEFMDDGAIVDTSSGEIKSI